MNEYGRMNGDDLTNIPKWMKLLLVFIDRVGFPVLAFILMFFMCYQTLDKVTNSLKANTEALIEMSAITQAFQTQVAIDHKQFEFELEKVREKTYGSVRGVSPVETYK